MEDGSYGSDKLITIVWLRHYMNTTVTQLKILGPPELTHLFITKTVIKTILMKNNKIHRYLFIIFLNFFACIQTANESYIIQNIAGIGYRGYDGEDLLSNQSSLNYPYAIWANPSGDVIFGDSNNWRIRKISGSSSRLTTIAGNGEFVIFIIIIKN
jgi:hypothetical protein